MQLTPLTGALEIAGDASITGAAELHRALGELFSQAGGDLRLDVSELESCDAAVLQLLFAARKTARRLGRTLQIAGVDGAVAAACRDLGLRPADLEAASGS